MLIDLFKRPEQLEQFSALLSSIPGVEKIDITFYHSVKTFKSEKQDMLIDIINVADFDAFAASLNILTTLSNLQEWGQLFISTFDQRYRFNKNKCLEYTDTQPLAEKFVTLKKDLVDTLKKPTDTPFYCAFTRLDLEALRHAVIPAAREKGYKLFSLAIPLRKQKELKGIQLFLCYLFPDMQFDIYSIDPCLEKNLDNQYGSSPMMPILEFNKTRNLAFDLIYWSTNQCAYLPGVRDAFKSAKFESLKNTLFVADMPFGNGNTNFRFHPTKGFFINETPSMDETFREKIEALYQTFYQAPLLSLNETMQATSAMGIKS